MKSILISIKPKWCAKILNGEKTIEVRTTAPKDWLDYLSGKTEVKPEPSTVYIYCTKDREILTDNGYGKFYVTDDDETKSSIKLFGYSLNGKVIAKYTLDEIYGYQIEDKRTWEDPCFEETTQKLMGMGLDELHNYVGNKTFYGWHISDLEIFDKPRELWEFSYGKSRCLLKSKGGVVINGFNFLDDELHVIKRPPQSWCYVEELK